MNVTDRLKDTGSLDPNTRLQIEKDPPGANTVVSLPAPYNGNDIVPFNKSVVGFTRYLYETNSDVRNAVNMFRKHVMKSGIVIDAQVCGQRFRFNQEDKQNIEYYSKVLIPGIERIITDWILFGYSVVRMYPPTESDPLPYFTVMRTHMTEEYIEWKDDRRQYNLYYSQSRLGPERGKPVPGGMILMLHPPSDSGMPDTELTTVLEPLARSEFIWSQYINSAYYSSRPPFVVAPESHKGGDALAAKVGVWGGNAYLGGAASARRSDGVETSLGDLAIALAKSIHTQETMPQKRVLTNTVEDKPHIRIDKNSPSWKIAASIDAQPWLKKEVLNAGERLQPAPRSAAPEKFMEIQESIVHKIYRAIGIPPEMLTTSHQKHAANVEQTTAELRTNVVEFQGKARTQFSAFFTELFSQLIDSKICAEAARQGKEKDVRFLKTEKERAKVDFQFEYNPIITPELLFSYHDQGIIRPEKFQEFALLIAGMPQDAKEPDLEKAIQRKLDMQVKAKAKASPQGQSASGKVEKPLASSSSSKTTSSDSKTTSSSSKPASPSSKPASTASKGEKRKRSTVVESPSTSSGKQSASPSNKKQKA